jgi:hypothetical protein
MPFEAEAVHTIIASEAKQSSGKRRAVVPGLLRRCAPRNDDSIRQDASEPRVAQIGAEIEQIVLHPPQESRKVGGGRCAAARCRSLRWFVDAAIGGSECRRLKASRLAVDAALQTPP